MKKVKRTVLIFQIASTKAIDQQFFMCYNTISIVRRCEMKEWTKPFVTETSVGLEVTSYLPAEIDVI